MMKQSELLESRYIAGRMETGMQVVAALGAILGVLTLLTPGWPLGVCLILIAAVAYGISRLFSVAIAILGELHRASEQSMKTPQDPRPAHAEP